MTLPILSCDFGWIEERSGCSLSRYARGVKAVDKTGAIRAMVAFDAWRPGSAEMHVAAETPIAWRALAGAAFRDGFVRFDRQRLFGLIAADNQPSLRLAKHAGLKERARMPDGWAPGVDLVLMDIARQDCRYLKEAA